MPTDVFGRGHALTFILFIFSHVGCASHTFLEFDTHAKSPSSQRNDIIPFASLRTCFVDRIILSMFFFASPRLGVKCIFCCKPGTGNRELSNFSPLTTDHTPLIFSRQPSLFTCQGAIELYLMAGMARPTYPGYSC
jgi:hypothetical protein